MSMIEKSPSTAATPPQISAFTTDLACPTLRVVDIDENTSVFFKDDGDNIAEPNEPWGMSYNLPNSSNVLRYHSAGYLNPNDPPAAGIYSENGETAAINLPPEIVMPAEALGIASLELYNDAYQQGQVRER